MYFNPWPNRRRYRTRRNTGFNSRRVFVYLKSLKKDPKKVRYERQLKEYKTQKVLRFGPVVTNRLLRRSPHYRGYSHNILRHFAPREHVKYHKARF